MHGHVRMFYVTLLALCYPEPLKVSYLLVPLPLHNWGNAVLIQGQHSALPHLALKYTVSLMLLRQ